MNVRASVLRHWIVRSDHASKIKRNLSFHNLMSPRVIHALKKQKSKAKHPHFILWLFRISVLYFNSNLCRNLCIETTILTLQQSRHNSLNFVACIFWGFVISFAIQNKVTNCFQYFFVVFQINRISFNDLLSSNMMSSAN